VPKFSTVFQDAPYPASIIRLRDGTFLEVNEAYCRMLECKREQVIGMPWKNFNLIPHEDDYRQILQIIQTEGRLSDYEMQIFSSSGIEIVLLLSIIPIIVDNDKCMLLVGHDITQRKHAEEALRQVQNELARELQEHSALQERQRLARELHDSVSQALYGISLGAHTALTQFHAAPEKSQTAMNYVLDLAQAGMTEMRALIFELRPESLKSEGLVAAINKQVAAIRARNGIEVEFTPCEEPAISLEMKEAVYRITLEAVHNAVKHSRCTHVKVVLNAQENSLEVEIDDNGVGFDSSQPYPGHLGLKSMRERAAMISGEIEITSQINQGSRVHMFVPMGGSRVLEDA